MSLDCSLGIVVWMHEETGMDTQPKGEPVVCVPDSGSGCEAVDQSIIR